MCVNTLFLSLEALPWIHDDIPVGKYLLPNGNSWQSVRMLREAFHVPLCVLLSRRPRDPSCTNTFCILDVPTRATLPSSPQFSRIQQHFIPPNRIFEGTSLPAKCHTTDGIHKMSIRFDRKRSYGWVLDCRLAKQTKFGLRVHF